MQTDEQKDTGERGIGHFWMGDQWEIRGAVLEASHQMIEETGRSELKGRHLVAICTISSMFRWSKKARKAIKWERLTDGL